MPSRSRIEVLASVPVMVANSNCPEPGSPVPALPMIIPGSSVRKLYSVPSLICSRVNEALKSKLKSLLADDAQGNDQPIRCLYACSFSSGARDTAQSITSWLARWMKEPLKASAIIEHDGQPAL